LQGAGAAADSYANYPKLQADIATQQAIAGQGQQKVQQGDIYKNAANQPMVLMPNGSMTLSQWNLAGRPATRSQSTGAVNPSVIPSVSTAGAGSPANASGAAPIFFYGNSASQFKPPSIGSSIAYYAKPIGG